MRLIYVYILMQFTCLNAMDTPPNSPEAAEPLAYWQYDVKKRKHVKKELPAISKEKAQELIEKWELEEQQEMMSRSAMSGSISSCCCVQ